MTYLVNAPASFADEALRGFVAAHPALVRAVYGGVVRTTPGSLGKVAVVVGGGSGHYPAFAGFVGPGFADGAVAGHVFTSPSVGRVHTVASAASRGGGVLLACGNYAGDELNFSLAAERLRADGIGTRLLLVSDDIASAPDDEWSNRRGIAGGLVVFKIAAAAAESGADLDTVERIARAANAATRTLGVAFAGCTLPGEPTALFDVPSGRMATGLGIHGEPGISQDALPCADELADVLVSRVIADTDVRGRAAAVLLNGLGATKAEELYVLWHSVLSRLRDRGVRVIAPEVGEFVTSLDMAGCSLTITWLDDELEALWVAPCRTPAFTRVDGERFDVDDGVENAGADGVGRAAAEPLAPSSADAARPAVELLIDLAGRVVAALAEHQAELGRLDAIAGDGDHGAAMARGSTAALAAVQSGDGDVAQLLTAAAHAWGEHAGGTSGVLWSCAIEAFASALRRRPDVAVAAHAAVDAVARLGRASPGDKTMLDAMTPFVAALDEQALEGVALPAALAVAAEAATNGARATAGMRPRVGRARPLAERSVGHQDPGAASFAVVVRTIADSIAAP